jgi:diacylglycerol kinase (ATP)
MATPEICFLFNAHSDSGNSTLIERKLRAQINDLWPNSEFILTQHDAVFWNDLKTELKDVQIIVACGGDGTVHKAGNLAIHLNALLGFVPIGSGNDFAHMLGIPKSIPAALTLIKRQNFRRLDAIKLEGDIQCYCLNTAGIGLDGMANHYTNIYKKKVGKAGYLAGALKAIFKSRAFSCMLSIDGKSRNKNCLMVTSCNGRREGGSFWVAPEADPNDGLLDLLVVHPMTTPARLLALPAFMLSGSESSLT